LPIESAPNTRMQRTRSSPSALRSPLMRCPLGSRNLQTRAIPMVSLAVMYLFLAQPSPGLSGRNVFTQLAGLKAVSVFVVSGGLDGIDSIELAKAIKEHLAQGGVGILDEGAEPQLVVRIVRNYLPWQPCPEAMSVQVSISLRETVKSKRHLREPISRATTWDTAGSVSLMLPSEAADFAQREVLSLVDGFASDVQYAAAVSAKALKPHS
jgi:hypothetical protein